MNKRIIGQDLDMGALDSVSGGVGIDFAALTQKYGLTFGSHVAASAETPALPEPSHADDDEDDHDIFVDVADFSSLVGEPGESGANAARTRECQPCTAPPLTR